MDMDLIKVKRNFVIQVQNKDNDKTVYQTVQAQNLIKNERCKNDESNYYYFDNEIVKYEPEYIEIDYENHNIKCEETEIKLECESLNSPLVISNTPYSEDSVKYPYFVKLEQHHISPDANSVQYAEIPSECIEDNLKTHTESQVTQAFLCTECNYKTSSKEFFKTHMQQHITPSEIKSDKSDFGHAIGTFQCASCSYKTMRHHSLVQHYQRHHQMTFNCANCNYETENNDDFKEHVIEHEKVTRFSCEKCPYETYSKCLLNKHILAHQLATLTCVECNYETENRMDFERHLTMHVIDAQTFSCNFCDYKNKSKDCMEKHYAMCHIVMLKCPKCNYETKDRSLMKDHLLGHELSSQKEVQTKNGDPSAIILDECSDNRLTIHKCKGCEFKTESMLVLERHSLCHDDEKQIEDSFVRVREMLLYKCVACDFETKHKTTLKQHQARHFSRHKRYFCKHCEYKTFFEKFYRQHLLSHGMKTTAKLVVFECDVCQYKAKDKNDLKIHSLKHRDVSKLLGHKCAFCDGKGSICKMGHGKSK